MLPRPSHLKPALAVALAAAVVLSVSAFEVHSNPGLPQDRPSHLAVHRNMPPDDLLRSLAAPDTSELKGYAPADEARLSAALAAVGLHQRVLKIAVAAAAGQTMALIKLQASDQASGAFRVSDLEADAIGALGAAFAALLSLQHIDLWSVVPGDQGPNGQVHETVFSVASTRKAFEQANAQAASVRQKLGKLSLVRYAPLFLRYAADSPLLSPSADQLPPAAFCVARARDEWGKYTVALRAGGGAVRALLRGRADSNMVAITIDDGPHPLIIPLMLATLQRMQTKATFFVVGEMAEEYPALVREIAAGGHEIGNHTYGHLRLSTLSAEEAAAQLRACSAVISTLTGRSPTIVRPPGGNFSAASLQAIAASGMTLGLWTQNAGDWHKSTPRQIADRALAGVGPGSVILMHDGDPNSVKALGLIIIALRERGLRPVTLSEMIDSGAAKQYSTKSLLNYLESGWRPSELR